VESIKRDWGGRGTQLTGERLQVGGEDINEVIDGGASTQGITAVETQTLNHFLEKHSVGGGGGRSQSKSPWQTLVWTPATETEIV